MCRSFWDKSTSLWRLTFVSIVRSYSLSLAQNPQQQSNLVAIASPSTKGAAAVGSHL
jgi:hypothetical protein